MLGLEQEIKETKISSLMLLTLQFKGRGETKGPKEKENLGNGDKRFKISGDHA